MPPRADFADHRPDFAGIHLPGLAGLPDRAALSEMLPPFGLGDRFLGRIEVHGHLPDGTYLTLDATPTLGSLFTPQFAAYIGGVLVIALTGSIWAIALATRPLRRLSEAADRFGTDVNASPIPETGPREVKQAAAAFNRMQRRLRQLVSDRTRMLAAISHDLRTPLTRMRPRAEMLEDFHQRAKMLMDLEQMEEMVGATLAFARDEVADEKSETVDLGELLASVTSDAHVAGQPVELILAGRPIHSGAPARDCTRDRQHRRQCGALWRGSAEIAARNPGDDIVISVTDHGPGIPIDERENVLRPFYRCEASRSRETGGIWPRSFDCFRYDPGAWRTGAADRHARRRPYRRDPPAGGVKGQACSSTFVYLDDRPKRSNDARAIGRAGLRNGQSASWSVAAATPIEKAKSGSSHLTV